MIDKKNKKMVRLLTPHKTPRNSLDEFTSNKRVFVRLGASKKSVDPTRGIIINPLNVVRRNADKLTMKKMFTENGIPSPEWALNDEAGRTLFKEKGWNVVYKRKNHSGGKGMLFYPNGDIDKNTNDGILERRLVPKEEYRIHCVPALNKFFAVKKIKRKDCVDRPERNLETCVFIREFDVPDDWDKALALTKKALEVMELDLGCVDIMRTKKSWYIIETNSGPGMGAETGSWYKQVIQELIDLKTKE